MLMTVNGTVETEKKVVKDLYVEISIKNLREANGLDRGKDPLGKALSEIDSSATWAIDIGEGSVCGYRENGNNDCYALPIEAQEFLMAWTKWFIQKRLGKTTRPFKSDERIDFILSVHEYPEEHLVPDYLEYLKTMDRPKMAF